MIREHSIKDCPRCYHCVPNATRCCFNCGHEFYPSKGRISPEFIAEAYARRCAGESWEAISEGKPYEPCSLRSAVYLAGYRIPHEVGRPKLDKPSSFTIEELERYWKIRNLGTPWKIVAAGSRFGWKIVKDACYRYKQMQNRCVQH